MRDKRLDQFISQLEAYLERMALFNRFIDRARSKDFTPEDEQRFLELKSNLVQETEAILAKIDSGAPAREDVSGLIALAPSLRTISLSQETNIRHIESQWHKLYLAWQAVLGQLKVRQGEVQNQSFLGSIFGRKK